MSAKLRSTEALRLARAALAEFAADAGAALAGADATVQRAGQWLTRERPAYWKHEVRRIEDAVNQARMEIERKRLSAAPEPASTVLERKRLERARQVLDEARARQDASRRWAASWDRETLLYKGRARPLTDWIQGEWPRAQARLDALTQRIAEYEAIDAPDGAAGPGANAGPPPPDADSSGPGAPPILIPAASVPGLRAASPIDRDAVAPPVGLLLGFVTDPLLPAERHALERLDGAGPLPDGALRLLIAWAALRDPAVVLHRVPDAPDADSGWTVAPVQRPDRLGGWFAARVDQLLEVRPDWAAVLRLPPGSLVVIAGGGVRAVLDGNNRWRWGQPPTEDHP